MTWVKASMCGDNGSYVEVAFTRSSYCASNSCVEVARTPEAVMVRDSKLGDASPVLSFDVAAWRAFVRGVRDGT